MRFIIIGLQRSGTSVLAHVLKKHPDVSLFPDELKVEPFFTEGIKSFGMGHIPELDVNEGYIKLFDAISKKNTLHWGVKLAIQEPNQAMKLVRSLNKNFPQIHVFIINREDSIARIGSLLRAIKSGHYHSWNKGKSIAEFSIPKRVFKAWYLKECWINYWLQKLELDHITRLSYDLYFGNDINTNLIYKDFGLKEIGKIEIKSKKVSPKAEEYIKNYFVLKKYKETIKMSKADFESEYKVPLVFRIRRKLKRILNVILS